jgi:hypothetical protein
MKVRERDHLYLGVTRLWLRPLFLHLKLLTHLHILGGTGRGKTYRALLAIAQQLAMRKTHTIIIIDLKQDETLAKVLRRIAGMYGLPYRVVSTDPRLPSAVFNPLDQPEQKRMTPRERAEMLQSAFGFNYGDGYGRDYYATVGQRLYEQLCRKKPICSMCEAVRYFADPNFYRGLSLSDRDADNATNAVMLMERGADILVANLTEDEVPPKVAAGAVKTADLLARPQILHLCVPVSEGEDTARMYARLALNSINLAAKILPGPHVPVFVGIDEAHHVVKNPSIATFLEQSRHLGMSIALAHQSLNQLRTFDADYGPTIQNNTATKIFFGPYGRDEAEVMKVISGEELRILRGRDSRGVVSEREVLVSRIGYQEMLQVANRTGDAIVSATPQTGLTRLAHPVVVRFGFTFSEEEFDAIAADPWPAEEGESVVAINYQPPRAALAPPPPPGSTVAAMLQALGGLKRPPST